MRDEQLESRLEASLLVEIAMLHRRQMVVTRIQEFLQSEGKDNPELLEGG